MVKKCSNMSLFFLGVDYRPQKSREFIQNNNSFEKLDCHSTDKLVGWLVGWLVAWLLGCLVAWLVGWLVGCLVAWLLGCLVGCLVGWLVGWFRSAKRIRPRQGWLINQVL